jgi:sigma-B regulation protein RsbU (phosphoserine phosphatase)
MSNPPIKRLRLSNFKLNSLLAITQAINENLSTEELLSRYEELLKKDMNIGKIVLFKFNGNWDCILSSGVEKSYISKINVNKDLVGFREISFVTSTHVPVLDAFDIVIPVYKNNLALAYVLIGDIEEGKGVSPVIKHLHFVQTLSNIIVVAIENIRLFNESLRQEALKKELELASKMQTMLIPRKETLPRNEKLHLTSFYHPHFDVGGDYYDCIILNKDEVGFCIADVSGQGISAALLMSNFQANLRALFTHEISLPALVERLNERVISSANGEKFITLFIAKFNYRTNELVYINAGHNAPILYKVHARKLQYLKSGCVGMGMLDEIPSIKPESLIISSHTKLLCYTDGLVELLEEKEVGYGTQIIEERLSNTKSIEENIDAIIKKQRILEGSTAIFDDITMLGAEFMGYKN